VEHDDGREGNEEIVFPPAVIGLKAERALKLSFLLEKARGFIARENMGRA